MTNYKGKTLFWIVNTEIFEGVVIYLKMKRITTRTVANQDL